MAKELFNNRLLYDLNIDFSDVLRVIEIIENAIKLGEGSAIAKQPLFPLPRGKHKKGRPTIYSNTFPTA